VWTPLNSTANETDGISIDGGDNDTQVSILWNYNSAES
jgi:hypothetical protein